MDQELEKIHWTTAYRLRNNLDVVGYKHIILGLFFLNYLADSFEELKNRLKVDKLSDTKDKKECLENNVFYVPSSLSVRWNFLLHQRAKSPSMSKNFDCAFDTIEKGNPTLKEGLPIDSARLDLALKRLGDKVVIIDNVGFKNEGYFDKSIELHQCVKTNLVNVGIEI